MNFRKRLQNLERQFACNDTVTLIMPDGRQEILQLPGHYGMFALFQRCIGDPACPEAELIRGSVSQVDSSGGHIGELIWSLLNSPVDPNEEMEPDATRLRASKV
jgi:hypothetical protein